MARFHITAKGEPGVCRAKNNCPLGGETDHYPTREEAQQAFEEKNKNQLFHSPSKMKLSGKLETLALPSNKEFDEFIKEQYKSFNRDRKVNVGEFAEANSGLLPLLSQTPFTFKNDEGVEEEVTAIDFGEILVTNDGVIQHFNGMTSTINKEKIAAYAEDLNAELMNKGEGIHEAAANVWSSLGLNDFPKAPSTQKSDFYVITNNKRRGVSVKSFIGSPPTIANSSGANSTTTKIPLDMTLDEAKELADIINSETSASARISLLKSSNLSYETSEAELPEIFSSNIDTIAEIEKVDAKVLKKDYSSAVTRFYLGDKTLTESEKNSLRTIATHYSKGMNASTIYKPEENDVELFLLQNSDGTSELHTAKNSAMKLVLEDASSTYRKNQLAKVEVIEENGKPFFKIPFSAGFRTVPDTSKRAIF